MDIKELEQKIEKLEQSLGVMEKLNEIISQLSYIRFDLEKIRNDINLLKVNQTQIPIQYPSYPSPFLPGTPNIAYSSNMENKNE